MRILIVDDSNEKVVEIFDVFNQSGIDLQLVEVATTAATAMLKLKDLYYDFLIVDLVIPNRLGEPPSIDGGVKLLKKLHRSSDIIMPEFIMGLTASEEALDHSHVSFSNFLWSIELTGPGNGEWKFRMQQKIQYLTARENQNQNQTVLSENSIECDILFVCALLDPEIVQLHLASGVEWEQITFPNDPTLYWRASLCLGEKTVIAYSTCLPQMGLVAAASGVSQATRTLSPRIVVMTGICAGRKGDCNLGDAISANITWDYGSGKFVDVKGNVEFEPSPVHVLTNATVHRVVSALTKNSDKISEFYTQCPGYRPHSIPKIHVGPIASGAAVQNHKEFFSGIANQNRKILGADMEAFGVAWACHQSFEPHPKCLIVKGVSDFADGTKNDNIQTFASFFSAKVALEALVSLIED